MLCSSLHHVEVCVKDLNKTTKIFTNQLCFDVIANRETKSCHQKVLKQNDSIFIITERKASIPNCEVVGSADDEHWSVFCCRTSKFHKIDSVFNSALNVSDVTTLTEKIKRKGGEIIKSPTKISDSNGEVHYSIIGTPIGNTVHTLIDKSKYNGPFLPGFNCEVGADASDEVDCSHIDHVAYICEEGDSAAIIQWYEEVFGMKRFLLNSTEEEDEGFVIRENVGLRLKALEYWRCFETGLYCNNQKTGDVSLKVVIGEPISEIEGNHVSMFLDQHEGPGIQHIALHSQSILSTVQALESRGIAFRKPPPAYYHQGGKLEEMSSVGLSAISPSLERAGLLLDTEADPSTNHTCDEKTKYLLQIFTKPLFNEQTFFMEVMHRAGAEGFGVGNITALARSIEHQNRATVDTK